MTAQLIPVASEIDVSSIDRDHLFRSLIDHSLGLVSVLGRDGTVLYASPSHQSVLGYSSDEITGRSVLDLVHPDDRASVRAAFDAGIGSDRPIRVREFRFRHADGSWRICEAAGRDLATHPVIGGVVINTHDVTARKQVEAERERENAVSAALARIGHELMGARSRRGLIDELCRLAAETLNGGTSSALLHDERSGAYVVAATHEAASPHVLCPLPDAAALAEIPELLAERNVVVLDRRAGDGSRTDAHWLCIALRKDTRLRAFVLVGRGGAAFGETAHRIAEGIAQLGSLALENALLLEQLERANRVKSDFVATMSHELRTPLNIILGYLSLVEEGDFGPLSDTQREVLGLVDRNARVLLDLVQDTLDLTQLERDDLPMHRTSAPATDLLRALDRETSKLPRKSAVAVTWTADEAPALHTDHGKLRIALRALVTNALKFTEHGRVTVSARRDGDGVAFTVADTGIGIPQDAFARIFEPFTQLGATSTRTSGGVGLGLYIARRLVELLGGTIDVVSRVGSGSTFTIWIPAMAAMATHDPATAHAGHIAPQAEEHP